MTTYVPIVRPPICESLDISLRSDTPLISAASINGIAINFKELIKMVPKGFIQSLTKSFPHSKFVIMRAKTTPKTIPINILQCNASFFIKVLIFTRHDVKPRYIDIVYTKAYFLVSELFIK